MASLDERLLGGDAEGNGAFMKGLFKCLVMATKASNAIPAGGEGLTGDKAKGHDYGYHAAVYPDFAAKADDAGASVLKLIDEIVRHVEPSADGLSTLGDATDPSVFESLADMIEDLLEDVDVYLTEGGTKAAQTQVVDRLKTVAGAARRNLKSYRSMQSQTLDIVKPQEAFPHLIDNSRDTVFIPRPAGKPAPTAGPGQDMPHPYEQEIRNFEFLPWQLRGPVNDDATVLTKPADVSDPSTPPVKVVATYAELVDMANAVREELDGEAEKALAIDLEAHSVRSFQGLVCLMQVSTRAQDYLVDTLALRGEKRHDALAPLADIFADHTVVKVLHGAESDIKWLQRDFSCYVVNMFDTFLAAKQLNISPVSLASLLQKYCDVTADKSYQLADWRVRPLPADMIKYAREDTHYLLYIHDRMRQDLESFGGKEAIQAVLDGSREVCLLRYKKDVYNPEGYIKLLLSLPGAKGLGQVEMQTLKALYDWRDKVAREQDESVPYVCPDRLLVRIARTTPRTFDGLQECANQLPPLLTKHADAVLQLISTVSSAAAAAAQQGTGNGSTDPTAPIDIPSPFRSNVEAPVAVVGGASRLRPTGLFALNGLHGVDIPARSGAQSPDQLSTSPVANTDDLYHAAGWTSPFAPAKQNWATGFMSAKGGGGELGAIPAAGNEGLEAFRGLEHTMDLSEEVLSGDDEEDAMGVAVEALSRAGIGRSAQAWVEGGEEGEAGGQGKDGGQNEDDGELQQEEEDVEEAVENIDMPRSMSDIYKISNRNRRRNKEKKRGGDQQEAEDESAEATSAAVDAGNEKQPNTAMEATADPAIDDYFDGSANKRKKHDPDDAVRFMADIGWISKDAVDAVMEGASAGLLQPSAAATSGFVGATQERPMPPEGPQQGQGFDMMWATEQQQLQQQQLYQQGGRGRGGSVRPSMTMPPGPKVLPPGPRGVGGFNPYLQPTPPGSSSNLSPSRPDRAGPGFAVNYSNLPPHVVNAMAMSQFGGGQDTSPGNRSGAKFNPYTMQPPSMPPGAQQGWARGMPNPRQSNVGKGRGGYGGPQQRR